MRSAPTARPRPQETESQLFQALADPTRRAIFERICEKPRPVGLLAAGLPVSRPAVSQHLRVLLEAGLVQADRRDTRRIYSARPERLELLRAWLERRWEVIFESFARAAEQAERDTAPRKSRVERPRRKGESE